MARQSFKTYQTLLGLPGNPVEYIDNYSVSDKPSGRGGASRRPILVRHSRNCSTNSSPT